MLRFAPELAKMERGPIARSGPVLSVWHQTGRSVRQNPAFSRARHPGYGSWGRARTGAWLRTNWRAPTNSLVFLGSIDSITVGSLRRNEADQGIPSRPFVQCPMRLLFAPNHYHLDALSGICHLLSGICHPPSGICHPPSLRPHSPFRIPHFLTKCRSGVRPDLACDPFERPIRVARPVP
jgi:hypothetical protein